MNTKMMSRRSMSLDSFVIPEKQEQLEQRKKALVRHHRRSITFSRVPTQSCKSEANHQSILNWESQPARTKTAKKQGRRSLSSPSKNQTLPNKAIVPIPQASHALPRPTVSRWDTSIAKDNNNNNKSGVTCPWPSPPLGRVPVTNAVSARKGRVVPNHGPPRLPVKQSSLDRAS